VIAFVEDPDSYKIEFIQKGSISYPKWWRGQIAALLGARNPHTFRFLRAVRLALYPAPTFVLMKFWLYPR
jgi:hypothetical protein